jgi:hypothetical protein
MIRKLITVSLVSACFCGYIHAQSTPVDFLGITPKTRRSLTRTNLSADRNPFRKLIGAPARIVLAEPSGALLKILKNTIGGEHIGGVIVTASGEPQIIIRGHCFSVNEDLLIADSKGVWGPMVSGHKVRIVGITTEAVSFEVTRLSGDGCEIPENVTLRYDDFFHFD